MLRACVNMEQFTFIIKTEVTTTKTLPHKNKHHPVWNAYLDCLCCFLFLLLVQFSNSVCEQHLNTYAQTQTDTVSQSISSATVKKRGLE